MAIFKIVNSKGVTKKQGLKNVLAYVLRPEKTEPDTLCFVTERYNSSAISPAAVYEEFSSVKEEWNRTSGRQYIHSVLSFHQNENITPDQCLDFGIQFAEKIFPGLQTLVAVHTDKDHLHLHFVTNTVNCLSGRKYQKSRKDLERDKIYCNKLCEEFGLSVAEKSKHFDGTTIDAGEIITWSKDKYHLLTDSKKGSYVADCGLAVIKALDISPSKSVFVSAMAEYGWTTVWDDKKKHITFINRDGQKVRDTNLKKSFGIDATKEGLENEFSRQSERRRAPNRVPGTDSCPINGPEERNQTAAR